MADTPCVLTVCQALGWVILIISINYYPKKEVLLLSFYRWGKPKLRDYLTCQSRVAREMHTWSLNSGVKFAFCFLPTACFQLHSYFSPPCLSTVMLTMQSASEPRQDLAWTHTGYLLGGELWVRRNVSLGHWEFGEAGAALRPLTAGLPLPTQPTVHYTQGSA